MLGEAFLVPFISRSVYFSFRLEAGLVRPSPAQVRALNDELSFNCRYTFHLAALEYVFTHCQRASRLIQTSMYSHLLT